MINVPVDNFFSVDKSVDNSVQKGWTKHVNVLVQTVWTNLD